jgi:hypothetical protein
LWDPALAGLPPWRELTGVAVRHVLLTAIFWFINMLTRGSALALPVRMKTLRLLLLIVLFAAPRLAAQDVDARPGARIASVQISGLDTDRLSHGLRADIDALTETPFDPAKVGELAARIEEEHPERITAVRAIAESDGAARIVILVARISDSRHLESNINSRYTIEKAELEGVGDLAVSQALRDDLQALVGTRLDRDATEKLIERLRGELPGYEVTRHVSRGTERGRVVLILRVEKGEETRWLHFTPSRSKFLYHETQGWSGFIDIPISTPSSHVRVTPFFSISNDDDLVEEYEGLGVRVETREVLTQRLALSLELSRFHQEWRDATLAALATLPGTRERYRYRTSVTPLVTFAVTQTLSISGGVSAAELKGYGQAPSSESANIVVGNVAYANRWKGGRGTHTVDAAISLRKSTDALNSDFDYTRAAASAVYQFRVEHHRVIARGAFGRISGEAPLFERFTLGDSSTLRGWNKYDIAPAGADRMFHGSLEYRYRGLALFLDQGAVWDEMAKREHRVSSGVGFHGDNAFFTIGVPLNADKVEATVMFGVRF